MCIALSSQILGEARISGTKDMKRLGESKFFVCGNKKPNNIKKRVQKSKCRHKGARAKAKGLDCEGERFADGGINDDELRGTSAGRHEWRGDKTQENQGWLSAQGAGIRVFAS